MTGSFFICLSENRTSQWDFVCDGAPLAFSGCTHCWAMLSFVRIQGMRIRLHDILIIHSDIFAQLCNRMRQQQQPKTPDGVCKSLNKFHSNVVAHWFIVHGYQPFRTSNQTIANAENWMEKIEFSHATVFPWPLQPAIHPLRYWCICFIVLPPPSFMFYTNRFVAQRINRHIKCQNQQRRSSWRAKHPPPPEHTI